MIAVICYLSIGLIIVIQAIARGLLRISNKESMILALGVIFAWSVLVPMEIYERFLEAREQKRQAESLSKKESV